ncbi:MAG TPA: hypothetical protein VFG12_06880, partial [Rhodopila sp.]|nr:hypothetical protein [Rhodopila sp.]
GLGGPPAQQARLQQRGAAVDQEADDIRNCSRPAMISPPMPRPTVMKYSDPMLATQAPGESGSRSRAQP